MGAGVPDPSLVRAKGRLGGEVACLCALAQSSLTPLPSPPGEGPSTPGGFPRFQLIQDFSVNYNQVWTPALPLLSCFPLAPSPKCETPARGRGAGKLLSWGLRGSPLPPGRFPRHPNNLGGFPKLNHSFSYIYMCIYI